MGSEGAIHGKCSRNVLRHGSIVDVPRVCPGAVWGAQGLPRGCVGEPGSASGLCGGPRVCPGAVGGHLMPQALDYQDPNTAQLCRL